jgi:hypothetical protein
MQFKFQHAGAFLHDRHVPCCRDGGHHASVLLQVSAGCMLSYMTGMFDAVRMVLAMRQCSPCVSAERRWVVAAQ